MDFTRDFQPRQIIYLEAQDQRLYAEVIQVVESRQMGWVRPLLLVTGLYNPDGDVPAIITDVRSQADLLWSIITFRPALDTEVIPLLVELSAEPRDNPTATERLHQFMHQVWSMYHEPRRSEVFNPIARDHLDQ